MVRVFGLLGYRRFRRQVTKSPQLAKLYKSAIFQKGMLYQSAGRALNRDRPYVLHGNWQTERYFAHNRKELLNTFKFRHSKHLDRKLCQKIEAANSVSIHVRGGDYLLQKNKNLFSVLSQHYYRSAIEAIAHHVESPAFFVFTDDPLVAAQRLPQGHDYEFVTGNTAENSYLDMQLMSLCKHNIIANSTFSWWGAWLNDHKDKKVVAPQEWFHPQSGLDDRDIVPPSWIKISARP